MLSSSILLRAARQAQSSIRSFSVTASQAGGHMTLADTGATREYTHPKIGESPIVILVVDSLSHCAAQKVSLTEINTQNLPLPYETL